MAFLRAVFAGLFWIGVWFVVPAAPARADGDATTRGPTGLVIGGKLGGGLGEPLNESSASFAAEVELGYVLPPLDHALELFTAFAYTAPSLEGSSTQSDPRLPGEGTLHYRAEQQIGALALALRYRLPLSPLTPYAAAGGRLYFMRTEVSGDASGEPFGTYDHTDSAFGVFAALGVELGLGPGALLAEVQLGYAGLNDYVFRDTNAGGLGFMVGYRLMFPMASRAADEPDDLSVTAEAEAVPEPTPQSVADEPTPAAAARDDASTTPPADEPAPAADSEAVPAPTPPADSEPASAGAQVRGHIRSFSGEGLRATIRVQPGDRKASTDEQGYFQLDIPPGKYTVRLRAFGYVSQNRRIVVEPNGVTMLNVELGKK